MKTIEEQLKQIIRRNKYMTSAAKLLEKKEELGLTYHDLERMTGIGKSGIHLMLSGKKDIDVKVAHALMDAATKPPIKRKRRKYKKRKPVAGIKNSDNLQLMTDVLTSNLGDETKCIVVDLIVKGGRA